ncbi:hypothetical protein C0995_010600 [Termitomyces sp. Mi166|nr:hypothetical protein C0995_010600 [Termitomyces sp. Mi166\
MRFFKSFKLLHRRTKSEPSITLVSGRPNLRETASRSSSHHLPSTLLPIATVPPDILPVPHPNLRILDLEIENSRLRKMSAATSDELAAVKAQLTATQADLFAELHRSTRQRQSDQNEIRKLHEKVTRYEEFIVNLSANESLPGATDFSHIVDQALSNIVEREANLGTSNPVGIVSPFGYRSRDQYMSALQLTLKSRLQLKQYKKIAKFWKNTALQDARNVSLVTPSASTISSIIETLPLDRQKAVDDLITHMKASQLLSLPGPPEIPPQSELATTEAATEVAGALSPSRSLPQSRPCLSPLASQSLRQELSKFASTNRLANWPHISRRPLEQLDLNVRSYHPGCAEPVRRKQHSIKPIHILSGWVQRDRQRATKRRPMSDPFAPLPESSFQSYSQCTIRNDSSGHTASPPTTVIATRLYPDALGDINEENERHSDLSFSSNITSLGWVDCQKEDFSFGSNTETLIPTTLATSVAKDSPRRTKSKIPLPVFKTLRRFSSTRLATSRAKDAVATSHRKKTPVKLSPTRLPARSR